MGVAGHGCFGEWREWSFPGRQGCESWVGRRFALSERKRGRKPRVEKGPPDVSWVRAAPGVGWAVAAAFPAEACPWVGTEVTRRQRFRKGRRRG